MWDFLKTRQLKSNNHSGKYPIILCIAVLILLLNSCESKNVTYFETSYSNGNDGISYIWNNLDASKITSGGNASFNPYLSPNNTLLVYQKVKSQGNNDIYSINIDGTEETQLTFDQLSETMPVVSPWANTIAFFRGPYVYIMNIDGTNIRMLADIIVDINYPPIFSSTGRDIFVTSKIDGGKYLGQININSGDVINMTPNSGGYNASMLPNSDFLVYVSGPDTANTIYTVNISNRSIRSFVSEPGRYMDPVYSEDEGLLVYSKLSESGYYNLYSRIIDGNITNQLTWNVNCLKPMFIPDGGWIAFTGILDNNYDISFVNIYKKIIVNYTNSDGISERNPVFSRDLSNMYFESNYNGTFHIWSTSLEYLLAIEY